MIFYDFEVFEFDWLVVLLNTADRKFKTIINNSDELTEFYEQYKNDIWVGFNNKYYDQYILKGILLGFNPKKISDFIIIDEQAGYKFSPLFRKIYTIQYDVMNSLDKGLKVYEGYQGKNIKESSVPFNINRKLTNSQIQETVKYCRYDVENTFYLFCEKIEDFNAHLELVKMASKDRLKLSLLSKTGVQLSSIILDAKKPSHDYNDEFDLVFPDNLEIKKYKAVVDWYKDPKNRKYKILHEHKKSTKNELKIMVAGCPHVFGYGGVHGALEKYHGDGFYLMADVTSLYPSLMLEYDLLSRSCSKEGKQRYKVIYHERVRLKAEGKEAKQAPLKLVLNGTYGAMKDKYNNLYDPLMANLVCLYGQLFLLDLIEQLEQKVPGIQLIQSNTDGILLKMLNYNDYDLIDDVCYEWEQRTHLKLKFDEYSKVFQKDVNNYLIIGQKIKSKGAYVKKLDKLDNNLPILNKALCDYMINNIPVEVTINNCNDLMMFQQVDKLSSKYVHAIHGAEIIKERVIRSFASLDNNDRGLYKIHATTGNAEKISNTSEHCFIFNDTVDGVVPPAKLDRNYYISMANKRLNDFIG